MAFEYAIGLGSPMVFRLVSYALYVLLVVALLRLTSKLLPRAAALAAVALFAVHPVHVEAIALGVNQGELIVALIAVLMTHRYVARRLDGALSTGDWAVLASLYGCAALTKENGFVLPALLVAAELFVVRPRIARDEFRDRTSSRSLAAGFGVLAIVGVALLLVRMAILNGSAAGAVPAEALVGVGFGDARSRCSRWFPLGCVCWHGRLTCRRTTHRTRSSPRSASAFAKRPAWRSRLPSSL